jgi:hypothetical protein
MSFQQINKICSRKARFQYEIATLKAMTDEQIKTVWEAITYVESEVDTEWLEIVYSEMTIRNIPAFN